MRRHLFCAIALACLPTMAQAKMGRCLLSVHGRTYLSGPCDIAVDKDGSFSIGVSETHHAKYFAYVNMDDEGAHGFWNETPDASHAHSELGVLKRDGACWANSKARVCAYR